MATSGASDERRLSLARIGATKRTAADLTVFSVAVIGYAVLLGSNISSHEPWADETQAWLIARDCSLAELWTRYARYEGTPPVWHTILLVATRLHLPFAALNWISGIAGLSAAIVLMRVGPFPLWIRVALPFTYFLAYQYAVIARGYALVPLLLFLYAHWRTDEERNRWRLTGLLIALAGISAHCMLLSGAIWMDQALRRRKLGRESFVYVLSLIGLAWSAWPPADGSFLAVAEVSWRQIRIITGYVFRQAFGEGWLPALVLSLSAVPLYTGGGWAVFLLSASAICIFSSVVHGAVWHYGLLFTIWLYALWIAYPAAKAKLLVQAALVVVVVVQCGWTIQSSRAEHKEDYSGSRKAGQFLAKSGRGERSAFIGYATVGLQPFSTQLKPLNPSAPEEKRFWWWSVRNHANAAAEHLGTLHPDQVWIGYQSEPEKLLWEQLASRSGYIKSRAFEGGVYWRDLVLQPDSIELYVPGANVHDARLASSLAVANPDFASQLLWGFGDTVSSDWRRVDRSFTVALPKIENQTPGKLRVHFNVESGRGNEYSTLTMFAAVGRHQLRAVATVTGNGEGDLVWNVPTQAMAGDILSVSFSLPEASAFRLLVSSIELTQI